MPTKDNESKYPAEFKEKTMNCIKCGKPLRSPSSIARGMGPVCAGKAGAVIDITVPWETKRGMALKSYHENRADYTYTVEGDCVCIIDLNRGNRTVTNDAENVIKDLLRDGVDLSDKHVIYKDSEGVWDELLVKNNHFLTFRALRTTDIGQAKIRARILSVNPALQSI